MNDLPEHAQGDIVIYPCSFTHKDYLINRYEGKGAIIISDPPYNIGFKGYNVYKDNLPEWDYIQLISTFKDFPAVLIHYPEESIKYYVPAMGKPPDKVVVWCYNSSLPRRVRNSHIKIPMIKE
jgi:hypothetical protein